MRRKPTTSNASRSIKLFTSKWYDRAEPKSLNFRKQSNSGRSSLTGRVIVWTKKSITRRVKLLKINYSFRSKEPAVVSTLKLVPFSNKLLTLVVFSSGAFSYFPALDSTKLFSMISTKGGRLPIGRLRKFPHYGLIYTAKAFTKVSNLELSPGRGVQYTRSAGCFSKITRFDYENHTALVKLPSGVRKFFSLYSILLLGPSALKLKRKLSNTKSGFWRSYGLKPKVRGVARNPVDHPHGGRTKSIKYPRTPWGKTTKFK